MTHTASTVGDPSVRWLVVRCYPTPKESVLSYLYGTSIPVHAINNGYGEILVVLIASTEEGRADYLANYQRDRLASGLIWGTIYETYAEAILAATDLSTQDPT